MESKGASERPNWIEYLSARCHTSQRIPSSPSEARMPQNVPVFEFLQTADANWNSLRTLPDWRQVWGSLCCNKDFEKALGEIQLDTYHHGSGSLYIEMLVQGELGRRGLPRRQSVFLVLRFLARAIRHILHARPGLVRICVVLCMQPKAVAHVTHPTWQAASAGGASRPADETRRKASTSRSSSLSGQVSKP